MNLEKFARKIAAFRMQIPFENRVKFDIEAADIYSALSAADADADEIFGNWEKRIPWLTDRKCCKAPPRLQRKKNENPAEYLNRCFEKIGL